MQLINGKDQFSFRVGYHSGDFSTPDPWGDAWTIAIAIFRAMFQGGIGAMTVLDGLCRAYQNAGHDPRVFEPEDIVDPVARVIPCVSSQNYSLVMKFERAGLCRMSIFEAGNGVQVGTEKTWAAPDALGAFFELGISSFRFNSMIFIPQTLFFNGLVIDYTTAQYPILDYTPTFAVAFDSHGGSAVAGQLIESGGLVSEPADPTRTGYTFVDWFHDAGGTNDWNFATDTISAVTTIHAVWLINSYAVTFDSQGGSAAAGQTINYGGLVSEPTAPARAGYAFGGWYQEAGCTTAWTFSTDTITATRTLYAKWTDVYNRVTFDSQGGSAAQAQDVTIGSVIGTIPVPYRAGYVFLGWFTRAAGAGTLVLATTIPTADMTVYASWIAATAPVGACYMTADEGAIDSVAEGSTKTVEVSFFDEAGTAMIPDAVTWSLYNGPEALVNARADVAVTPAATVRIVLSGLDHQVTMAQETRRLVVQATYTSTDGASLPLVAEFEYPVTDVAGI